MKEKVKQCIPILMAPLGSLGKISFINNFSKMVCPIFTLAVAVSLKWLISRQDE